MVFLSPFQLLPLDFGTTTYCHRRGRMALSATTPKSGAARRLERDGIGNLTDAKHDDECHDPRSLLNSSSSHFPAARHIPLLYRVGNGSFVRLCEAMAGGSDDGDDESEPRRARDAFPRVHVSAIDVAREVAFRRCACKGSAAAALGVSWNLPLEEMCLNLPVAALGRLFLHMLKTHEGHAVRFSGFPDLVVFRQVDGFENVNAAAAALHSGRRPCDLAHGCYGWLSLLKSDVAAPAADVVTGHAREPVGGERRRPHVNGGGLNGKRRLFSIRGECEMLFVEVKSPNDRLSDKQLCVNDLLLRCGFNVEVCHVVEPLPPVPNSITGGSNPPRSTRAGRNDDDDDADGLDRAEDANTDDPVSASTATRSKRQRQRPSVIFRR